MSTPNLAPEFQKSAHPFQAEGPQPLMREIPLGQPYPKDALGPLQEVVEAVTDITKAPLAIAAQSALSVASLVVQGFANVTILSGSTCPTSLFCLTIAESGERKSSSDSLLMRGIRRFEEEKDGIYQAELQAFENNRDLWAGQRKEILIKGGRSKEKPTGAAADLQALGVAPQAPLYPKLTAQDPTFEGLLKLYQTARPALGLFSDEAGGFIGGYGMNSDNRLKTIAGLSQLWGGETVDRIRAGDGASSYRGRRLAVHLMAQPIAARPLMADPQANGQGFLARFLITEPPSLIGTRLETGHKPESDIAVEHFADRVTEILAAPLPTKANPQELRPRTLTLSPCAIAILQNYYQKVEVAQAAGGEMEHIRSHASKSTEQAARLAGVLTLWQDLHAQTVEPEAMRNGVALAEFYLSEAKRLTEAGLVSEETSKAECLRKWLTESWLHSEVTPRDIVRLGPNRLREMKVVRPTIDMLALNGWLEKLPEGQKVLGSHRKEAYRILGK